METIVTEIMKEIKKSTNAIEREKQLFRLFVTLFCECVRLAFERLDDELAESYKDKGFHIERKDQRTIHFLFGSVTFSRRRMAKQEQSGLYPLDKHMGFIKHQRYSPLVLRNITELATKSVYRHVAKAVELLTPLAMSHQKVNQLVLKVGDYCEAYEETQETQEVAVTEKRKVPYLCIEGDGVMVKGQKRQKLELHRIQVSEGVKEVKGRVALVNPHFITDLSRKKALKRMAAYLDNQYHLRQTVLVSNSDGGAGYTYEVFDELALGCLKHEHFRDRYHVNRKIKDRLRYSKELQPILLQAVHSYDEEKVTACLDTAESLILEVNQEAHLENVRLLRNYLHRNWAYLRPVSQRSIDLSVKGIGTCESNHRHYTYRMKRQGRIWSEKGAQSMIKVIDSVRNGVLDQILTEGSPSATKEPSTTLKGAVRQALKKGVHQAHNGAIQGRIYTDGTRTSGMSKLAKALSC